MYQGLYAKSVGAEPVENVQESPEIRPHQSRGKSVEQSLRRDTSEAHDVFACNLQVTLLGWQGGWQNETEAAVRVPSQYLPGGFWGPLVAADRA